MGICYLVIQISYIIKFGNTRNMSFANIKNITFNQFGYSNSIYIGK